MKNIWRWLAMSRVLIMFDNRWGRFSTHLIRLGLSIYDNSKTVCMTNCVDINRKLKIKKQFIAITFVCTHFLLK